MKVVWFVACLAAILVGVGIACAPQEKYCYFEHQGCTEAQAKAMQDYIARQNMLPDAAPSDAGATVID